MPEQRPLVTVVTPSYNYGRYIGDCLASVRRQTYPAVEHIVLDACSTDDTAEVIGSFRGSYDLQAFFEKDQGQADAINKGFARGRGEILCWLNADDFWLHDRVLEEAVAALRPDVDVVVGRGFFVAEGGERLKRPRRIRSLATQLRYEDPVLQPATFWRRTVHRPLRTDLHYVFDWVLFLEMSSAGARFDLVPHDWAAYRLHGVNKSVADPSERKREIAEVLASTCGARSFQARWARATHRGYQLAERARVPLLKRAIWWANAGMYLATGGRVVSC